MVLTPVPSNIFYASSRPSISVSITPIWKSFFSLLIKLTNKVVFPLPGEDMTFKRYLVEFATHVVEAHLIGCDTARLTAHHRVEDAVARLGIVVVGKVMPLLFNMLSMLVINFLPRSEYLLISWLQSPSAVILEPQKIKSVTVSPSISHEVMGPDAMIFIF